MKSENAESRQLPEIMISGSGWKAMTADVPINDEKLTLLLVHGSPRKINEYLFEDRDEKSQELLLFRVYRPC